MATVTKLILVVAFAALAAAAEPEFPAPDSLRQDTLTTAVLDTTRPAEHASVSSWVIPLAVVCATTGVFLFLFSARSKS